MPADPESTPPVPPRTHEEQAVFGQSLDERLEDLGQLPRPVDLRTVPRERWPEHVGYELALPPEIECWIDGATSFSEAEIEAIESALEKHHGIAAPFAAYLFVPVQGRPTATLVRE